MRLAPAPAENDLALIVFLLAHDLLDGRDALVVRGSPDGLQVFLFHETPQFRLRHIEHVRSAVVLERDGSVRSLQRGVGCVTGQLSSGGMTVEFSSAVTFSMRHISLVPA